MENNVSPSARCHTIKVRELAKLFNVDNYSDIYLWYILATEGCTTAELSVEPVRFGWTASDAVDGRKRSRSVCTAAGEILVPITPLTSGLGVIITTTTTTTTVSIFLCETESIRSGQTSAKAALICSVCGA